MLQTNDNNLKNISVILLIFHLSIALLINLYGNVDGLQKFLGGVAYTIGNQIIVFISFFLLLYKKISKIGTYISILLQVLASIGLYCAKFIDFGPMLGIVCGILCNTLFIASMLMLFNHNCRSTKPTTSRSISISTIASNSTIEFCRKCGNRVVIKNAKFCYKCGAQINWKEG